MEIERKFLIKSLPENLDSFPHKNFKQGYLCTEPVVRVRKEENEFFLTYKSGGLMSREETNLSLSEDAFEHLLPKCDGIIIEKVRYFLPIEGTALMTELDIFGGELAPLTIAEVEFGSEEQAKEFTPLEWFGREVTNESAYHNSMISQNGLPADFPKESA